MGYVLSPGLKLKAREKQRNTKRNEDPSTDIVFFKRLQLLLHCSIVIYNYIKFIMN